MTASNATRQSASTIRRAGAVCLVAGLGGLAGGIYLAVMDPDVSTDRFSYPQGAGEFFTIQVFFVLQHLGLLLGLLALARTSAVPRTRLGLVGTYGAVAAMAALALMEAVAITARNVAVDSTTASVVGAGYGVVSIALGATLLTAGIAIVRAGAWQGWRRWVVLALGAWVFFPMIPALVTMTDGARLAIAGWMLLFAALGAALMRNPSPNNIHPESNPTRRPKSGRVPHTAIMSLVAPTLLLAGCGGSSSAPDDSSAADVEVPSGTIAFRRYLDAEQTQAAVFTMSTDGSGEEQITKPPDGVVDQFPDWSPDGKQIAFQREFPDKPFEVHVMNADGSGRQVFDPGCPPDISSEEICEEFDPSWSPDGKSLAFSWAGGEIRQVRGADTIELLGIGVAGADGFGATMITQPDRPTTSEDLDPTWSPDGKRIAFFRLNIDAEPIDKNAIFVANADGSEANRITPWKLRATDITWSPDGELIVFRSEPNPAEEHVGAFYTVRPDGTDLTRLTETEGKELYGSSFSPDSQWIVFAMTGVDGFPDLYTMRKDGSDLTPLTKTPDWESAPDWSPR